MKTTLVLALAVGLVAFAVPFAAAHSGTVICVDDPVCYAQCQLNRTMDFVKNNPTHICYYYQS